MIEMNDYLKQNGVKRKPERLLLIEAYRRYHQFAVHNNEPLKQAWLGLGTPKQYNSKYFKCIDKPQDRIVNWFYVSDEGAKIIEDLNVKFPWKEEYNYQIFIYR